MMMMSGKMKKILMKKSENVPLGVLGSTDSRLFADSVLHAVLK